MTEQGSLVQEGVDRFNSAYESIDREVQRLQKQLRSRRKSLEKQLASGRKKIEKRTRKQVEQLRTDLRQTALAKRARSLRSDVTRQVERGVEGVLGALQIASKSDVQRVDRKLSQINRKLKDLEQARKGNGNASAGL